ncbi:centromere DNA-binding protein complex CBF3 subunit [Hirsutella rhossiliensis]|uniref:Centromere DNA-binding protein complex CBF3 subunit n=1 Tax=Hirsutella rhossiliensis TaxID=111463 RepID=A0A9P8MMC2_9HYPO|nr:centromere DNA-binding protein complex CBF3 subunit [Hirsutella rhossiliensis]KAH0957705.1 centromere DNA-binding protein complex CBF3 subunit [Hirsutella rhossiliensis]
MAADDSYTAADERARAARRAGIQAKKDEQPANTTRSYAAKQREWKAWCHTPRAAADGSLYSWPDGELVTPDKLAAWLKEDILLRRVVPPQKKPRAREQLEAAAMAEAESLAEALEVPLAEAAELLADDREGYVPPTGLATAAVAHGNANTENPRGAAVRGFLEQRGRQRGKHDRASFKDRGSDGIQAGYLPDEWLRIQDLLLTGAAYTPQNLRTRVDLLFGHYYLLRGEPPQDGACRPIPTRLSAFGGPTPVVAWTGIGSRSSSGGTASRLSYPTQLQETWRIFGAAGLIASKKTHLPRRVGAQDAETHGTSLAQISQAGRWNQSVLCQAYLTHLPRQFMRIVAGFSASRGLLPRACGSRTPTSAGPGRPTAPLPVATVLRLRPFGGPEWDEFAVAVRSTAVGLWRRAASMPSSKARSYHLYRLLRSRVRRGAGPSPGPGPVNSTYLESQYSSGPGPRPRASGTRHAYRHSPGKGLYGGDVWKEWEEGFAGQKAVRELEETWEAAGAGNGVRVQFCRRKVIWDELLARMASGKCKEAAVAELELLRAGRSLNRLVDELKQRRRRGQDRGQGQGQIRVQVGTPCPMTQVQAGTRSTRGQGRRGGGPGWESGPPSST